MLSLVLSMSGSLALTSPGKMTGCCWSLGVSLGRWLVGWQVVQLEGSTKIKRRIWRRQLGVEHGAGREQWQGKREEARVWMSMWMWMWSVGVEVEVESKPRSKEAKVGGQGRERSPAQCVLSAQLSLGPSVTRVPTAGE